MVDFAQSRKDFEEGWRNNESRRRALLSDLMEIILKHASRRFGCAVENKIFLEHLSEEKREQYFLDAYALGAMNCVAQVMRWCKRDRSPQFDKIRFVFEDGDEGKGKLMTRFDIDLQMTPYFEVKKDKKTELGERRAFTPLQAADFLAYEILRGCKEMDKRTREPRWGIVEFIQMPGDLGLVDAHNLKELVLNHEIAMNTFSWFNDAYGGKSSKGN